MLDHAALIAPTHIPAEPLPAGLPIEYHQKACDAYDWSDPDFDRILREGFRSTSTFQRKQWEWVMIYRALEANNALRPDSRGIAFGAGREPLIYVLAERIKHLLATDLYSDAAHWGTARTQGAPKQFLLEKAPFAVDPARLDAAWMDMTTVDYSGPPVDFCYSSCSFEHIGKREEDFIGHLAQVKRVLKPGGVYVLTTELHYGPTLAVPHSFFFGIDDLIRIVARSGLAADPVFDLRVRRCPLNAPSYDAGELGLNAPTLISRPHVTPFRHGRIFTSVMLVLRNSDQPMKQPRVLGYHETEAWMRKQWRQIDARLWHSWQRISPTAMVRPPPAPGHAEFAGPARTALRSAGADRVFLHTAWLGIGPGRFAVNVVPPRDMTAKPGRPVQLRIVGRRLQPPMEPQIIATAEIDGCKDLRFEVQIEPEMTYAIIGRGPDQNAENWSIFGKRL